MYTQLPSHLTTSDQLIDSQWHARSTTTALITTINDWSKQLDQRKGICSTSFELKKAFNSIRHRVLVNNLSQPGLNNHILRWLASYLTNRRQKVMVEGKSSDSMHVISGVRQASILGPILLLIYINDINQCPLSTNNFLSLYADDIFLYKALNHNTWCTDIVALQQDMGILSNWVDTNFLSFNSSKCKFMLLSKKTSN